MADKSDRSHASNPTAFLADAGPGRTVRSYGDQEVVYSQGGPSDAVFYLQHGTVKLTMVSKHRSKKAMLGVLRDGDLFGEGCLTREAHRVSTATSMGPCLITRLEKAAFRRKVDHDPAFAALFITWLLSQAARLKADLADHFLNYSERRLARILLQQQIIAHASKSDTAPLSQTTLAEMVGTTRSRVSGFMNKFRKKGLIRYNGVLEVDSRLLTAYLKD